MKKVKKGKNVCFVCQTCYFVYKDKDLAEECEAYCAAHSACSPEIIEKAVTNLKKEPELKETLEDVDDEE
ncbi:MAG TPA: hypothetical protein VKE88_01920 [Candidatus Nanoarchaeia archaeon]|nr:hypothetical protein [Candidatus Nanoarchaeia archaeon]